MPRVLTFATAIAALLLAAPVVAEAAPPIVVSVSAPDGYPSATFSAPRSSYVTVFVATKPDRATDGQFLEGNVITTELLVDEEARSGRWTSETPLPPGTYWVLLQADPADDCFVEESLDPSCADGYSMPLRLVVTTPVKVTFTGSVRPGATATLTLRRSVVLASVAYRVCFPTAAGTRTCRRGVIGSRASTGSVRIATAGLARTTTFSWTVGPKVVATKRARVR